MRNLWIGGILLLMLLSINQGLIAKEGDELIGELAPKWGTLKWMNSQPLKLSELEDKVVLIRWWTETCPFCSRSAPALNEFHDIFKEKGLVVVGMYHPKPPGPRRQQALEKAVKRLGFEFPIALDMDWSRLRRYWLANSRHRWTSVSFLIDKRGKIRYIHPGGEYYKGEDETQTEAQRDYDELKGLIEKLIAEPSQSKTESSD
jgi:peroxiredoxin